MSIITCKNFENNYVNEKQQNPVHILSEIFLQIFCHLNLATLGKVCLVSKEWKKVGSYPNLWKTAIYREIAFGSDKWAKCFGEKVVKEENVEEEFSSLPWQDFIDDCQKFQKVFPGKIAKDTLMLVRIPKTLNGGLTLKNLGELAKKYFSHNDTGYRFILPAIIHKIGNESIPKSIWVMMTKDTLPETKNKNYQKQQSIVNGLFQKCLTNYEIPETLIATTCIFSQYFFDLKTRLFNNSPWNYTRCKENIDTYQITIGCFAPKGLYIQTIQDNDFVGAAAIKKF